LRFGTALLLLTIAVSACDWSKGVGPGRPIQEIKADVEGQPWLATTRIATYESETLIIEGVSDAQVRIRIRIPGVTARGVYFSMQGQTSGPSLVLSQGGATWSSTSTGGDGLINLTLLAENRAAGTFRFTAFPAGGGATGTKVILNGSFALDYTQ
jgi:hypothetical protein